MTKTDPALFQGIAIRPECSHRFATLSGDWNPMHTDPVVARRFGFGGTIAHGVHVCLWAIDQALAAAESAEPLQLRALSATFSSPVKAGQEMRLTSRSSAGESSVEDSTFSLNVVCAGKTSQRIKCTFAPLGSDTFPSDTAEPTLDRSVSALTPEESGELAGETEAQLSWTLAAELFPTLFRRLPIWQLAEILSSTRIIGMSCPGHRALFSGLRLKFTSPAGEVAKPIRWKVQTIDTRFQLAILALESVSMSGTLEAFFRPAEVQQLTSVEAEQSVRKHEFAGRRALIIGGSRGLGEVTAKLLAAGAAHVGITYNSGHEDARKLVEEIRASGGSAEAAQLNVLDSTSLAQSQLLGDGRWTHVYYFACPHIESNTSGAWDESLFTLFSQFFVHGFHNVLQATQGQDEGLDLVVTYPSTLFLDEPAAGLAEYTAAKKAGEELAQKWHDSAPTTSVHCPRFPKMHTDQTNSVAQVESPNPTPVVLAHLRSETSRPSEILAI